LFETETASAWKEPGIDPTSSQVEVFYIPGAPAAEKDGSITNTMRMAQWHVKAVEPPGEARSDAAFIVDLGNRVKALYAASKAKAGDYLAHGWGFVWPANRRIIYNRASADPSGKPWSEKKKLIWWDAEQKKWVGNDVPDFPGTMAPDAPRAKDGPFKGVSGTDAFIMNPHGLGQFFASIVDGPFPEHYEPFESPTHNLLSKVQNNPVAKVYNVGDLNKLGTPDKYPYILTTYRLTEHHAAGMSRHVP